MRGIEAGEELVDCLGLHQALAEQPHRRCIRHRAVQPEPQEALERQAVLDLELRPFVRQRVERLEHEDFEHEHGVEWRTPALAACTPPECSNQRTTENLAVDDRRQSLQRITGRAQRLISI